MNQLPIKPEGPPVVVMITGSRDWTDIQLIHDDLDQIWVTGRLEAVIEGVCPGGGADKIAGDWAEATCSAIHERFPPKTRTRNHLLARNIKMVERAKELQDQGYTVIVLAYPLAQSRGTWHAVTHAERAGLRVINRGAPKE